MRSGECSTGGGGEEWLREGEVGTGPIYIYTGALSMVSEKRCKRNRLDCLATSARVTYQFNCAGEGDMLGTDQSYAPLVPAARKGREGAIEQCRAKTAARCGSLANTTENNVQDVH